MTTGLTEKRCVPCEGGAKPLTIEQIQLLRKELSFRWQLHEGDQQIRASFEFKNYFRTIAFVNAVAYIAITEDHHPEITFGYKACTISYWTTAIGGLSENDFICAAKIDKLIAA
jgi:4a-hydroxytetrahydrobiopterin dehydratase